MLPSTPACLTPWSPRPPTPCLLPLPQGTKASDPRPQSRGRPWDPPETDLTFQPAISPLSRKIMAGGGGSGGAGFLERLSNDLKKRHGKMRV